MAGKVKLYRFGPDGKEYLSLEKGQYGVHTGTITPEGFEALADLDNLPAPDELAADIIENLRNVEQLSGG